MSVCDCSTWFTGDGDIKYSLPNNECNWATLNSCMKNLRKKYEVQTVQ